MKSKSSKKAKADKSNHAPGASVEAGQDEKLQHLMDELSKEKDELLIKLQRVSADYANYQKRMPKQIADSVAYETKAIIRSLLPCLDNFEHALVGFASAETEGNADELVKGVRIVFEHILDALKTHGVEQIAAIGENFDPAIHEAIMQRTEEDKADNLVLEEFQRGYKLNGQVIRPSKVIVNKLPAEEDEIDKPEAAEQEPQGGETASEE